jgi:hypothetical protein
MASSTEAFDRFWTWKKSNTLLKVTVWEKGQEPITFIGSVVLPEEEALRVTFADHEERRPVILRFEDCSFRVGAKILFADRFGDEYFECEDTGEHWIPIGETKRI